MSPTHPDWQTKSHARLIVSWVPRSSFGFESDTPRHASWSPDGSLLAVATGTSVILYDPCTNVPRHTFVCRESPRPRQAHFIGPSGRFLVVIGDLDLVVWNVTSRSGMRIPVNVVGVC